ncbi:unnamed protein product [Cylindrotheca closterium]|uniref:NADH:flavin oxidoreductase/NADH oxidase N-terminal domain-containing protein n=1 Tax=Cylindrotheca closterium TaxID=2856 RepID=A0AAD2G1G4_9STRA|nr:unnamed protein product [Cylindrotheca closterium]
MPNQESSSNQEISNPLRKPLTLPCGALLKNRIIKACMSDSLGECGCPTKPQIRLYERWAEGGVGLSCVGEVQVDPRYPEKPGNLVPTITTDTVPTDDEKSSPNGLFRELTRRATINGAHLWAQLGHAGALTHLPVNPVPKGPSPLNVPGLSCEGMSLEEIQSLPRKYAATAQRSKELGFTGVLIHAGHGFLLSQFLSPLFNKRNDDYGGPIDRRCRLILEIIQAVRKVVGPTFPVGIRLNSTDQLEGGLIQEEALEAVRLLDTTSIDLIDISGGTYFPGAKSAGDGKGEGPYFLEFARRARALTNKPLVLTGGFKKRHQALEVLNSDTVDAVGIARALALNPSLATDWMANSNAMTTNVDPTFPRFQETVPGGITAWFTMHLTALGEDRENIFDMGLATALGEYEERDAQRTLEWRQHFSMSN